MVKGQRSKHALTARFSGSVHRDLDSALVGGHLGRVGEHCDGQSETFTCEEGESEIVRGGREIGAYKEVIFFFFVFF